MNPTSDIKLPFTEKFATQWELWLSYRKDIKKPYKSEQSITGVLKKLTYYTEDTAVKMLQNSIDNGYQGIFEIKEENGKPVMGKEVYIPTPTHKLVDPIKLTQDTTGVATHAKTQIELFHQTGEISDLGNVIYHYLVNKGIIDFTEQRKEEIAKPIRYEATRRRKRTEEVYVGNVESEIEKELLRVYLTENKQLTELL